MLFVIATTSSPGAIIFKFQSATKPSPRKGLTNGLSISHSLRSIAASPNIRFTPHIGKIVTPLRPACHSHVRTAPHALFALDRNQGRANAIAPDTASTSNECQLCFTCGRRPNQIPIMRTTSVPGAIRLEFSSCAESSTIVGTNLLCFVKGLTVMAGFGRSKFRFTPNVAMILLRPVWQCNIRTATYFMKLRVVSQD